MVRAKFKLVRYETSMGTVYGPKDTNGKDTYESVEQRTLVFQPVYSNKADDENRLFWQATPSGEIHMGVVNMSAWEHFELNKEYYVDFTSA